MALDREQDTDCDYRVFDISGRGLQHRIMPLTSFRTRMTSQVARRQSHNNLARFPRPTREQCRWQLKQAILAKMRQTSVPSMGMRRMLQEVPNRSWLQPWLPLRPHVAPLQCRSSLKKCRYALHCHTTSTHRHTDARTTRQRSAAVLATGPGACRD